VNLYYLILETDRSLASAWYNTEDFQDWFWTDRDGGLSLGYRQYFNPREDKGVF